MGVCNSPNIVHANIYKLLEGFVIAHAYIDNVILITKREFSENMKAL